MMYNKCACGKVLAPQGYGKHAEACDAAKAAKAAGQPLFVKVPAPKNGKNGKPGPKKAVTKAAETVAAMNGAAHPGVALLANIRKLGTVIDTSKLSDEQLVSLAVLVKA